MRRVNANPRGRVVVVALVERERLRVASAAAGLRSRSSPPHLDDGQFVSMPLIDGEENCLSDCWAPKAMHTVIYGKEKSYVVRERIIGI